MAFNVKNVFTAWGAYIKDLRKREGRGVKQKRTPADMGGGGSSNSERPHLAQI